MSGRLVHYGPLVVDLVLQVPALPERGGDVLARGGALVAGGGFTVLSAAARAGVTAVHAGPHGSGPRADLVRAALAAEGIESVGIDSVGTELVGTAVGGDLGLCVVVVDDAGERTFLTVPGPSAPAVAPPLDRDDLGYVSGYSLLEPPVAAALSALRGGTLLVDPGPLGLDVPTAVWDRVLARTALFSANATEARAWTGQRDLARAAAVVADRLPADAAVVVRDGAAGCLLHVRGATQVVAGFPVRALDTTGAGDTHCGVLAAALLGGADLPAAARRANAAAALAVTRSGPGTAPTRDEVDALLNR